jgi:hypothetical protein
MADCKRLDGAKVSFRSVFSRTPLVCTGAIAGLGSALWPNVVAAWSALTLVSAFTVVLVAVLAILLTAAESLVVADWRADVANCQAWAEIDIAAAELCRPAQRAAPSRIDPCYVVAADGEELQGVFCAHRIASLSPGQDVSQRLPEAVPATGIIVDPGRPVPPIAALETVSRVARSIQTPAASDGAMTRPTHRDAAKASLGRALAVAASHSARSQMLRAESTVSAVRLVANGGTWSDGLVGDRRVLPPHGHSANIVVLCGDRDSRDRCGFPAVSTRDGAVDSDELPGCRGPPTAEGRPRTTKRVPDGPSADAAVRDNFGDQVPVCAAELRVIETYLDEVLRDVLGPGGPDQDSQVS